ncbi:Armadillo-type [Corchorus olitorius]|uniref:Armadillo-type n=1 Tax=Corchorus olitorius TaxID=93759 RepID=A0A1R3JUF3_9ROSI|nr:Armadillo-type [Corchorus olitorius]
MEETIARILTDLEEISQTPSTQSQSPTISRSTLLDLQSLLSTNDPDLISQFFDDLPSKSLTPSSLTNLLSFTMDSAPSPNLSLLASKVYLSLLLSPNSPVFTLFTPISFLSLLRSLRRAFKNRPVAQPDESPPCQAPPNRKRKGGGKGRGTRVNVRSSGGYSEGEGQESDCLDMKEVFIVFERLVSVLGLIHLDRFPDSLKSLIQTVGEIPLMAMEKLGNSGAFNRLMDLCSRVLSGVLRSEHGEMANTAAEVLKVLLPLILLVKSQARSFALGFVTRNMMEVGNESEGVKKAVVNFPRYLAQKAPEKAEPRALAVESIMEVVKVMELDDQIGYIEYALKMTQGKANLRLLGVDLIATMLMSLKDPLGVNSDVEVEGSWGTRCLEALIRRCSDSGAGIRARALSSLAQAVGFLSGDDRNKGILKEVMGLGHGGEERPEDGTNDLLRKRCMDEKAVVRKAALLLVTKLTALLGGSFDGVVLKTMGVLGLLQGICDAEVAPWVKKICTSLGKKKRLKPKIAIALQNIIKTSESLWLSHSMPIEKWTAPAGAWFLLSEVSAYLSKSVDWEFLHHHWQLLDKHAAEAEFQSPCMKGIAEDEEGIESNSVAWAGDRVFLLQTISNVSVELPAEPAADLAHNLLKRVEKFSMHSTEVNAHVKALRTLCKRKALTPEEADQLVIRWGQQLLSKACKILEKYIAEDKEANTSDTFFTPPRSGSRKGKLAASSSRLLSEAVTAVYTVGSLVLVCPSADVSAIVPLLYTIITSGNPDPKLNKLPGPRVSLKQTAPSLYIQAWLTMGKICLADGKLAKSYIPLFVQELEKSDCAALRNNLVVMMADFCVRGNDESSRSKRMRIYVCLLKQMAPEHLLATFAKLCAEILAAASDGMLNIDDITGQSVLQDAFQILSCKEIRASSNRGSASETAEVEEEGGDSNAAAAAAKGRAITQAVRKGLIQNTIPIFIELKRLLESKNSPLIGSLMECLRVLLKDYKNEIDDILVADKQLQKELIYDMQKYESAKARTTAAEAVANNQNQSGYQSPHVSKSASGTHVNDKLKEKLQSNSKVASAMADAAAEATARSVLREVNKGAIASPLNSISMPKLKSVQAGTSAQNDRPLDVLESVRRRQSFHSDDENEN